MTTLTPQNAVTWLPGRWYIVATNFPMWLKGDRLHPTFNYTLLDEGRLLDEVRYQRARDGKPGSITGYDTVQGDGSAFVWRGKGLLFIARSYWRVENVAADGTFALIRFEKTLFTPAGVDVITRSASVDAALRSDIDAALAQHMQPNDAALTWL
jgi:hypothetical protein